MQLQHPRVNIRTTLLQASYAEAKAKIFNRYSAGLGNATTAAFAATAAAAAAAPGGGASRAKSTKHLRATGSAASKKRSLSPSSLYLDKSIPDGARTADFMMILNDLQVMHFGLYNILYFYVAIAQGAYEWRAFHG